MWFERNGKVLVSMPGVPHEMKLMMKDLIVPKLKQRFTTPTIHHQVIRTVGIGESFLSDKISSWERSLPPHIKLAYLPSLGDVKLRLTGIGKSKEELVHEIDLLVDQLIPLAGDYIFGFGEDHSKKLLEILFANISLHCRSPAVPADTYHLITSVEALNILWKPYPYAYEIKCDNSASDQKR
jgi:nicotinamide-nucleotide amidase